MSKVLSAKRKMVDADYEFLSGDTVGIMIVSLSTNEGKEIAKLFDVATGNDVFELIARKHLQRNAQDVIEAIIKEQNEEGNIIEFAKTLAGLIEEEKQGKPQD